MKRILLAATLLAIAAATPSSAPEPSRDLAQNGAPHVREALDPGDGSQTGNSPENPVTTALTTGGAPTPTPQPTSGLIPPLTAQLRPTAKPSRLHETAVSLDASSVTWQGILAYADPSYGPRYLAIPQGPGVLVRLCGPAGCLDRVSTDAGPVLSLQRAGRIADVSFVDFPVLCGVPTSFGLCPGSVTIERRALPTLPPTSTEEETK